jgi:hypothetical protein
MRTIQRPSIYTQSAESLGLFFGAGTGVAAWVAINVALFVPVKLERPALVKRLFCANGNVVSGNIDMGIYTVDGARIVSIGSTPQAGTTALQFFNITDTLLMPGQYFMAVALDNTTGTLRRFNISIIRQQHMGVLKAANAFALPSSVTFATTADNYIPNIGMELLGIT